MEDPFTRLPKNSFYTECPEEGFSKPIIFIINWAMRDLVIFLSIAKFIMSTVIPQNGWFCIDLSDSRARLANRSLIF